MVEASILVRPLRSTDRPGIAALLAATPAFRPEEATIALEMVDETLDPRPDTDYEWVVAEQAGRLVGFACFGPVPLTLGTFDLYWIAVDPATTRLGVATKLDEAVLAQVSKRPGARWLLAETSTTPEYAPACAFYGRRGYRLLGRLADYYRPGDDRLTFGKRLDGRNPDVPN